MASSTDGDKKLVGFVNVDKLIVTVATEAETM
jgi:hypothetical protein